MRAALLVIALAFSIVALGTRIEGHGLLSHFEGGERVVADAGQELGLYVTYAAAEIPPGFLASKPSDSVPVSDTLPSDADSCCGPTDECEFCEVWQ